jgi:flagellar hook protein FlgE
MSLTSGLFSGISGLSALGNSMTVIGDNIANVNTVGFKESRVTFQDVLSQTVATTAGSAQVGRGTSLAEISSSFAQGSFESTNSSTDLAIGGSGFFIVRDPGSVNNEFYSRAGEFRFDKDGNFVNPSSYICRGWKLDETTGEDQGTITDITMSSFTSSPSETDLMTMIMNLDSGAIDSSTSGLPTTITAVTNSLTTPGLINIAAAGHGYVNGDTVNISGVLGTTVANGTWKVINVNVVAGSFDLVGSLFAGAYISGGTSNLPNTALSSAWNGAATGDVFLADSASVYQTTLKVYDSLGSTHDVTVFFDKGVTTGSNPVWEYIVTINPSEDKRTVGVQSQKGLLARGTIEFNAASGDMTDITCALNNGTLTWPVDLLDAAATANGGYFEVPAAFIAGSPSNIGLNFGTRFNGTAWANNALSTSQYASASTTVFQSADGYGAGDLQSVSVATDGVITGQYSNGQVLPLYRVALAKFQNEQGLYKVGGNLFRETRLSGDPITGKPGTNGLGSISPNSLEQSNVDLATEFVKMITTQRGYQANSKIITTIDQMLAEVIQLKR